MVQNTFPFPNIGNTGALLATKITKANPWSIFVADSNGCLPCLSGVEKENLDRMNRMDRILFLHFQYPVNPVKKWRLPSVRTICI